MSRSEGKGGLLGMYIICAAIGIVVGMIFGYPGVGGVIGLCVAGGIHLLMLLFAYAFVKLIMSFFDSVSGRR